MTKLTSAQFDELCEQYSEIVVDRMETADLVEYVMNDLQNRNSQMSQTELREHIIEMENSGDPTDNLYDELAENVDVNAVGTCIVKGTDYSECVDRLVQSMEGN